MAYGSGLREIFYCPFSVSFVPSFDSFVFAYFSHFTLLHLKMSETKQQKGTQRT